MSGWTSRSTGPRSKGVPPRTARRIRKRDRGRCQIALPGICTGRIDQIDHIIPTFEHGSDEDTNLQGACNACHKVKIQSEAQRARAKVGRRRSPPPRPGSRSRADPSQ